MATIDEINAMLILILFSAVALLVGVLISWVAESAWRLAKRLQMALRYWRDTGLRYTWVRAWRKAGQ